MSILQQHKITKILKKNYIEYLCENHNNTTVSYRSFKSLKKNHPNLDETLIVICNLRTISSTHTQLISGMDN